MTTGSVWPWSPHESGGGGDIYTLELKPLERQRVLALVGKRNPETFILRGASAVFYGREPGAWRFSGWRAIDLWGRCASGGPAWTRTTWPTARTCTTIATSRIRGTNSTAASGVIPFVPCTISSFDLGCRALPAHHTSASIALPTLLARLRQCLLSQPCRMGKSLETATTAAI